MENQTLPAAFAAAQKEMKNPKMDGKNPHFGNRYASLLAVRDAVIPTLNAHGIALVQNLTTTAEGVACETILIGHGGELKFGPLFVPATKRDAQGFGSAATYARRSSLMAVYGVVGDEDDDANAAAAPVAAKPAYQKPQAKPVAVPAAPVAEEVPDDLAVPEDIAPEAQKKPDIFVTAVEPKESKTGKKYWMVHLSGAGEGYEKAVTFDSDTAAMAAQAITDETACVITFSAMKMGPKIETFSVIPF